MLKWINKKRNKKGFTLIELVVVIAILGVLGAIAVPRLGGFRTNATEAADKATAATIAKAAEMYVAVNGSDEVSSLVGTEWIDVLVDGDEPLIDASNITPQQDSDKEFHLHWADSQFEVWLGEPNVDGSILLYPDKIADEEPSN